MPVKGGVGIYLEGAWGNFLVEAHIQSLDNYLSDTGEYIYKHLSHDILMISTFYFMEILPSKKKRNPIQISDNSHRYGQVSSGNVLMFSIYCEMFQKIKKHWLMSRGVDDWVYDEASLLKCSF